MKRHRLFFCVLVIIISLLLFACSNSQNASPVSLTSVESTITKVPPTIMPTVAPTIPPDTNVFIGAVGDIMIMQSQVYGAKIDDNYDFTPSFSYMESLFDDVDILIGNLETPLAGEENEGYSGPMPVQPTLDPAADPALPTPKPIFQTFNAPDELAYSLKQVGFDALTTANNHVLDRGAQGALRTVEVIAEAGLEQTGTYTSEEDRFNNACIVSENGFRIGFVGWTDSVNGYEGKMSSEQRAYMVGRTTDQEMMLKDINALKEADVDYIIAFLHWDKEYMSEPAANTKELAEWILQNGVDSIFGAHPHFVQPAEYVSVVREDGSEHTGLVAYSLGNFISNMYPSPRDYGAYLQIELKKDGQTEKVSLVDAVFVPTICVRNDIDGRTVHQVVPTNAMSEGKDAEAYAHVTSIMGTQIETLEEIV